MTQETQGSRFDASTPTQLTSRQMVHAAFHLSRRSSPGQEQMKMGKALRCKAHFNVMTQAMADRERKSQAMHLMAKFQDGND